MANRSNDQAPLSPEEAAELYRAFLLDTIPPFKLLAPIEVAVAYTPREGKSALQKLLGAGLLFFYQGDGHLGARIKQAFEQGFKRGYRYIVVAGSDSPTLSKSRVAEAFQQLVECDLVLGPAEDGGYYLLGVAARAFSAVVQSGLLSNQIPWSSDRVYQQTVARLARTDLSWTALALEQDVDRPDDLSRLGEQIRALRRAGDQTTAVHTEQVLRRLGRASW